MAVLEIDFDPADVITVGVDGEPGQRTFFLEARQGSACRTLLVEKVQLQELGAQIVAILDPLEGHEGHLPEPVQGATGAPGWRIGSIQLSWDEREGSCTLLLEERSTSPLAEEADGDEDDGLRAARLVATSAQIRRLGERCLLVVAGGRPLCPLCHLPIDPSGHVCPASNGHHRS
ncbi:MAG: DUF3090 family protein [Candidatus Dormibacteria bacterium]